MPGRSSFAPYRIPPGALPGEAADLARALDAEPILVPEGQPLPAELLPGAMALVPAGRAGAPDEACRGADGAVAGAVDAPRACLNSERHRARVRAAVQRALDAGSRAICLDLPDAPLALGILGAGFCADCQRAFSRQLAREYGDSFQPLDYLKMAREAVTSASGAVTHERLAFGRDFWRARAGWLDRAVGAYVRDARDVARTAGREVEVAARFEAVGPAQLRAARHLDAAIFPVAASTQGFGAGIFRLLRAVMGRRPCAVELGGDGPLERIAAVGAACGVEVAVGEGARGDAATDLRRFAHFAAARGRTPTAAEPLAECGVLYSAESDLWTGGDHRAQLERTGDALAALQLQAPVILHPADLPTRAPLVVAGGRALSQSEGVAIRRRLESGGVVLCIGEPGAVDEAGRPGLLPFPAGKPAGVRVEQGLVVQLPSLPAPRPGFSPDRESLAGLERALHLLGLGRRSASTAGRSPVMVALHRDGVRLDAHLAALSPDSAQGMVLSLGAGLVGEARRGRFRSQSGHDERVALNPSGIYLSAALPTFRGYAVLSIPG